MSASPLTFCWIIKYYSSVPHVSLICTVPLQLLFSLVFLKLVEGNSRQISQCSIIHQDLENWDLFPSSWGQSEKELAVRRLCWCFWLLGSRELIDVLAERECGDCYNIGNIIQVPVVAALPCQVSAVGLAPPVLHPPLCPGSKMCNLGKLLSFSVPCFSHL